MRAVEVDHRLFALVAELSADRRLVCRGDKGLAVKPDMADRQILALAIWFGRKGRRSVLVSNDNVLLCAAERARVNWVKFGDADDLRPVEWIDP